MTYAAKTESHKRRGTHRDIPRVRGLCCRLVGRRERGRFIYTRSDELVEQQAFVWEIGIDAELVQASELHRGATVR